MQYFRGTEAIVEGSDQTICGLYQVPGDSKSGLLWTSRSPDNPSSDNPGNFLALIKPLSKYDSLLQQHLDYVKSQTHATTFLSGKIQNEFIELLGNEVHQSILHRVKKGKYYGMMFDTTPDIPHNEQMSQVC